MSLIANNIRFFISQAYTYVSSLFSASKVEGTAFQVIGLQPITPSGRALAARVINQVPEATASYYRLTGLFYRLFGKETPQMTQLADSLAAIELPNFPKGYRGMDPVGNPLKRKDYYKAPTEYIEAKQACHEALIAIKAQLKERGIDADFAKALSAPKSSRAFAEIERIRRYIQDLEGRIQSSTTGSLIEEVMSKSFSDSVRRGVVKQLMQGYFFQATDASDDDLKLIKVKAHELLVAYIKKLELPNADNLKADPVYDIQIIQALQSDKESRPIKTIYESLFKQ